MSQSIQEPEFYSDIYHYYVEERIKGKMKKRKIRVRISDPNEKGWYTLQRVRDGYILHTENIDKLTKE